MGSPGKGTTHDFRYPLRTKGFRGRRGRRCNLTNCCDMTRNQFASREPSIAITNPLHVNICPGGLLLNGERCPVDNLTFDCVYKLARVATIMSQTHTSPEMRMARILDPEYDALSPTGLGFAISFFSAKCLHVMQGIQIEILGRTSWVGSAPVSTLEDPYDPSRFDYACSWAVYSKPDDIQESWCQDESSAVVLLNPSKALDTSAWARAWQLILGMISDGVELFVLGTPRDHQQWPKAVDILRDLCEETLAQVLTSKSK
ncbi:hypothetical protein COOONC_28095 [Cooperia oncophora]